MFGELLGGMVDKVQITKDYISDALTDTAAELKVTFDKLFYMIKPYNAECDFKIYIYRTDNDKGTPVFVREIKVEEIVD